MIIINTVSLKNIFYIQQVQQSTNYLDRRDQDGSGYLGSF